jgi:hypothetical protein
MVCKLHLSKAVLKKYRPYLTVLRSKEAVEKGTTSLERGTNG